MRAAYAELRGTRPPHTASYRNVAVFLAGYWLYIGGVFTVIFMAANFGQRLGFGQQDLVKALMITNFVGFPATLLYAFLGHRFGSKPGIFFALAVYVVVSAWAGFMTDVSQFYVLANCYRLCAGWRTRLESLLVRVADTVRPTRRVLRFL